MQAAHRRRRVQCHSGGPVTEGAAVDDGGARVEVDVAAGPQNAVEAGEAHLLGHDAIHALRLLALIRHPESQVAWPCGGLAHQHPPGSFLIHPEQERQPPLFGTYVRQRPGQPLGLLEGVAVVLTEVAAS
ncbi:hypothetical protein D3C78_1396440 [compost metagenome]